MCGLCGIYSYAGAEPAAAVSAELVTRMRDTLVHRGPDDAGLYVSPDRRLALGHRRLSIIDTSSAGHQPMANENDDVWVAFNGEIYNHLEIRKELEARGHRFRSRADTEVIVHLYEELGEEAVARLEGMFAFALWDARARRLLLVRDRLGIKPLYYADVGGVLLFGSEPKALLAHPLVGRTLDLRALSQFLTFNAVPAPATPFRDVRKLRPGTILRATPDGVEERAYWRLPCAPRPQPGDEDLHAGRILELFRAATEKRMMSDVPFGALLSGGIDSSLNVACMSEILDRPVRTFSIGFAGGGAAVANELDQARLVAGRFGSEHREASFSPRDILEALPAIFRHLDDPIGTPTPISNYLAAQLVRREGVTVAQVGEGSDELFVGYPPVLASLRWQGAWSSYARLPGVLRRAIFALAQPLSARLGHPGLGARTDAPLAELLRRSAAGAETYWGFGNCFAEVDKELLLTPAFRAACPDADPYPEVAGAYREIDGAHPGAEPLARARYLDLRISLAERLLMRVDKMTMAFSVEARVPFLDHHLVEYVAGLPAALLLRRGPKSILKRACAGLVPDEIVHRPKMGFPTPIPIYFAPELRAFALDRILGSRIHELGLLDRDAVRRFVAIYDGGRSNAFFLLWNLFTLAYWYDCWVAGAAG